MIITEKSFRTLPSALLPRTRANGQNQAQNRSTQAEMFQLGPSRTDRLLMAWLSRISKEGICGDASAATPEFGKLMFETTATCFTEMTREFRTLLIKERVNHHE